MKKIDRRIDALKKVKDGLDNGRITKDSVNKNEKFITNMNTKDQLYKEGVNSDNVKIWSYRKYRPLTIKIKKRKGQPFNRVTLKDTGRFHSTFKVQAYNTKFEILSNSPLKKRLVKKYGRKIFGLTESNKDILSKRLKITILKDIHKRLKI